MAKRTLELVVVGNVAGADAAFKKAGASASKFAGQTEHVHTRVRKSFAGMSLSATKMASSVAGAYLGFEGVKKVVTAAEDAQVAQAKLSTQLKASGVSFEAHKKVIDGTISRYAAMSGFMDHNLDDAFTNIVRVTGNVNKSLKLTGLAQDFARAKGLDLAKAGELIGKVAGGNVGILSRYGLAIKPVTAATDALAQSHTKATIEQTRAAKATDKAATAQVAIAALQKKFAGQAEAYGKTAAGAQDRMKVAVDHLEVAIGNKLLPVLASAFSAASKFVQQMKDGTGAGGRFVDKLQAVWSAMQPLVSVLKTSVKFLGQHPALLAAAGAAWVVYKTAALVNIASVKAAELGLFGASMKAKMAGNATSAGSSVGNAFATKAGLVVAAGIAGWQIGSWLRKNVPAVKAAGDWIGTQLGQAIFGSAQEKLRITSGQLANTVRDAMGTALNAMATPGQRNSQKHHNDSPIKKPARAKGSSVGNQGIAAHASNFFPGSANMSVGSEPELARRLNALSQHLGVNFTAASGYRTPQHSVAVGGTANDPHTRGQAVDVSGGGIETIPESVLNQFGLTRPMQTWQGRDERNHIQLYGGGPSVPITGGGGGGSAPARPKGPSPAQLRAIAKKIAGSKAGGLKSLKNILAGRGPGPIHVALPGMGSFSGSVFSSDALLTALHGSSDFLQASFDSADRAATGQGLHGDLNRAAFGVRNAKAGKGESADAFSKRMGGLVQKVRDAKNALNAFTKEGERAKALKKIDLKITGVEQAKAYKEAIAGIRQSLHDAARSAADAFRTLREGEIGKAHDAAIAAIGDSADAKELARLQADDAAKADAKTTEQLNQALADAIKAGDVQAQKDAQDAINAYAQQKREDQLTANLAAATQQADDAQTVAMNGLDKEVSNFQSALDTKLQAEADQLNKRVENYKTFLTNVDKAVAPWGLTATDVVGASADQEAAVSAGPKASAGGPGGGFHWGAGHPGFASGGTTPGGVVMVGERGPELVNLPRGSRVFSNAQSRRMGGAVVNHYGDNVFKTATDHDRWANKLAFKLATA